MSVPGELERIEHTITGIRRCLDGLEIAVREARRASIPLGTEGVQALLNEAGRLTWFVAAVDAHLRAGKER